jgi:hypothetical protein
MMQKLCLLLFLQCWAFMVDAGQETALARDAKKFVLAVSSADGMGHACPVGETVAFSAGHVPPPLIWTDGEGRTGSLYLKARDRRRDFSILDSDEKFGHWFPLAVKQPVEGDRVFTVGFEFGDGMRPKIIESRVLFITAGRITLSKTAGPGSSGSCILNDASEVVGINVGFYEHQGSVVGLGVLIAGGLEVIPPRAVDDGK